MTVPAGGYPDGALAQLAQLERGHYWFEPRRRLIIWAMHRYFPKARSFVDVGCGTGFVLEGLAAATPELALWGTDFLDEGVAMTQARVPRASCSWQDARQLRLPTPVDVAGAFDVLEHIDDDEAVLGRLAATIRPGGGLILTVPQHQWLWSEADVHAGHVRRYTRAGLCALLHRTGFRVVRATSFVTLLLPVLIVTRRRPSPPDAPLRGLTLSPLSNSILNAVMTVEGWLVRLGVSWPWGGSLLVVARRPG